MESSDDSKIAAHQEASTRSGGKGMKMFGPDPFHHPVVPAPFGTPQ
jgi:hypothetical protein